MLQSTKNWANYGKSLNKIANYQNYVENELNCIMSNFVFLEIVSYELGNKVHKQTYRKHWMEKINAEKNYTIFTR